MSEGPAPYDGYERELNPDRCDHGEWLDGEIERNLRERLRIKSPSEEGKEGDPCS